MTFIEQLFSNIFFGLIVEILIVIGGYIIGHIVVTKYKENKFGNWHAFLLKEDDEIILDRPLSPATAERVIEDEAELNVYLKGLISPFGIVNCDLVTELEKPNPNLIVVDHDARKIIVHLVEPGITPKKPNKNGKQETTPNVVL